MSNQGWPGIVAWAWLAVAGSTLAAPEDDHRRGLLAYQRGDVVAAMAALRAPAQAGYAPAQTLLAFILDRADFVDEALVLYRGAAAQDDAQAHAALAGLHLDGRGVAKDEKAALRHFSKAAALGHAASIDFVADAHIRGQLGAAAVGSEEALAAVRRAAAQGHLDSVLALAQAHATGRWQLPVDAAEAGRWQRRAAELRLQRATTRASAKVGP